MLECVKFYIFKRIDCETVYTRVVYGCKWYLKFVWVFWKNREFINETNSNQKIRQLFCGVQFLKWKFLFADHEPRSYTKI
jgi:hypothetical protein